MFLTQPGAGGLTGDVPIASHGVRSVEPSRLPVAHFTSKRPNHISSRMHACEQQAFHPSIHPSTHHRPAYHLSTNQAKLASTGGGAHAGTVGPPPKRNRVWVKEICGQIISRAPLSLPPITNRWPVPQLRVMHNYPSTGSQP